MGDIKIFVSHRIDIDSELIDSPLYIPVRCGAVFDEKNHLNITGDDTGDNISGRRMSFCEFTVQYWAWRNYDAEYYGLCHYRRYLSFIEKQFKTDVFNMVYVPALTKHLAKKYVINDRVNAEELIQEYDVVVSEYANVENLIRPTGKTAQNVREQWDSHDGIFLEKAAIDLLVELIQARHPEYLDSANEYLASSKHRGFNCFIMRRELFDKMCQLQFDLMFEIERRLDTRDYTETMKRTPAFIGEILYGIFIFHLEKQGIYRIKELQMIFFSRTERAKTNWEAVKRWIWSYIDSMLRHIIDPIMPKGSHRRELTKQAFYRVFPIEPRGVAKPKGEIN